MSSPRRPKKLTAAVVALAFASSASGNNLVNFATVANTDFAMFGYGGMRATGVGTDGTGTITVSGVSGTVTRAILVWHGPTNSTSDNVNAAVTFNGTSITGSNAGTSASNCWGPPDANFTESRAYRAEVTHHVAGNGAYSLSNFVKGGFPNATADINGASLLVFYNDGNPANNRDIVVFLGNDSNQANSFDAPGWNATLNGINYSSGTATLRMIVSDGQNFADPENVLLNASVIIAGGQNFDGTTVPNGPAATNSSLNGGLWDHRATDITSLLVPGINNLTLSTAGASDDCLSLISTVFDLPAGAAPAPPAASAAPIPALSGWGVALLALLTSGFAALQLRRRRA